MTGAIYYPPADRGAQWFGPGNYIVAPTKVLWHTTETAGGWPGYKNLTQAPNLTYDPWRHVWRQHCRLDGTARALRNGPDYGTNRKGVCQVEISCYCDPARMGPKHLARMDQQAYDDLGAFAGFMQREWGIPLATGVTWMPYPDSYGVNGVRLSARAFEKYRGHCGHMHAPFNDHGDAGSLDVGRLLAAAGAPTIHTIPAIVEDDMSSMIFMGTVPAKPGEPGAIYRLAPGAPKRHLDPQTWGLYRRLFPYWGPLPGSPFLEAEVDMIHADLQAQDPE